MPENTTYNDSSIKNLPWNEYIRTKPGVYVGDIGTPDEAYTGIYFLFKEVVDNGVDEHLMGCGKRIDITLDEASNTIKVRDYGRGIPLNSVKNASCKLHTGAKFTENGGGAFEKTAGTHGIGIKAVNALSSYFCIKSVRDKAYSQVETKAGRVVSETSGQIKEPNGVELTFTPDATIYTYLDSETGKQMPCEFKREILEEMIRYYCYLNPGLTISLNGTEYHEPEGMRALIKKCPEMSQGSPLYEPIELKDENLTVLFTHIGSNIGPTVYAFTNGQYNPQGGKHVTAIKNALYRYAAEYFDNKSVDGKDILSGLVCVLNIRVTNPQFESQTKIKLGSEYMSKGGVTIGTYVLNQIKSGLPTAFAKNPEIPNIILARMKQAAKYRKDVQSISAKVKGVQKTARIYNRKLSDCNVHYNTKHKLRDESSIFITEGDSAGGNIVQVRDIATQAVFYLRGKPENSFGETYKAALENEELNLLVQALGVTPSDISGLRYNKVIIATDADDDGLHIRLLMLTFFMNYFPELIKSGHVYIFQTPLFRVRDKKKTLYAYDAAELARYTKQTADNREITRFKGLGEISPKEFRGFIGEDIRLDNVKMPDGEDYAKLLEFYMGKNTKEREEFVVKNFTQAPEFSGDTRVATIFKENYAKYSSYFNLDRALPEYADGLKPVQRRLMHVLRLSENGSYNKAATAVGDCMKYHPHGDASIYEALVKLAQKGYLIDPQGNWGHPIKGLDAAAPRYVECRLSKLAKEILFSEPSTEYVDTYDGKRKEPVTIPCKLPLVLLQGAKGMGASMACDVLPHNFNEVIDASIAYLRGEEFKLYPDFAYGGLIDVSEYRDGERGGRVTVRAKIEKAGKNLLAITEIPHGLITETVCQSIKTAIERGLLNIDNIRDNTTDSCNILLTLKPGADPDREIAALYTYTQCQIRLSTNPHVTVGNNVIAPNVSEILKHSAETTRDIIRREIEAAISKLREAMLQMSLEKIYIENRFYRQTETLSDYNEIIKTIRESLAPFIAGNPDINRELTDKDYERLTEIKLIRITNFDAARANDKILTLRGDCAKFEGQLKTLTRSVIAWYKRIKDNYGAQYPRRTEITTFHAVEFERQRRKATEKEWFIDTASGMAYDSAGDSRISLGLCAEGDRAYGISEDGTLIVRPLANPVYIGSNPLLYGCLEKDTDKLIDMLYQNRDGLFRVKRFRLGAIRSNTEIKLLGGGSKVLFCKFENGSAYKLKIYFKPAKGVRVLERRIDFDELLEKGRNAQGNLIDQATYPRAVREVQELSGE